MRWFSQRATPLRGLRTGAVITHIDITDRKVAERECDTYRLQLSGATAAATLGQLSGAIARELNQPLAVILANAHTGGAMANERRLSGEIKEIFHEVKRNAHHASEVIERLHNVLQYRPSLRSELVDVNGILEEALASCKFELAERDVEISTDQQRALPRVRGDSIVKAHNGQIRFSDAQAGGTMVTICLPAEADAA